MVKLSILTLGIVILSGCAIAPTQLNIKSAYNEQSAKKLLEDGSNTIKGSAFLRQNGGNVVTCAASIVVLIPHTPYTEERLNQVYKQKIQEGVTANGNLYGKVEDKNEPSGYINNVKQVQCDQLGNFEFDNVADGKFYVQTRVNWGTGPYNIQTGANLIQAVTVQDGEIKKLILTH